MTHFEKVYANAAPLSNAHQTHLINSTLLNRMKISANFRHTCLSMSVF